MTKSIMNFMPTATVQTYIVDDTEYRGANPQYYNIAPDGHPENFIKVAKGVPWRKVTDN